MSFRFLGPEDVPRWFAGVDHRLRKVGLSLEVLNTRLPASARRTRRAVAPLLDMPRLSTYPIGALINYAVSSMPPEAACERPRRADRRLPVRRRAQLREPAARARGGRAVLRARVRRFVDDAFATQAREATMAFVERKPDEYEVIFDRPVAAKGHPTFWNGITVFRKRPG